MQVKQKWSNASLVTPAGVVGRDLLVEGGRIVDIVQPGTAVGEDWQLADRGGKLLYPGLIDLLQHGFDVHLYNDAERGGVAASSQSQLSRGVTGFLPSISCLPPAEMEGTLSRLADEVDGARGARALGIHSEGPCFNSPGAHNPQNLQRPSDDLAKRMLDAAKGKLKAITVAPELPGAESFIKTMKAAGVSVHFGHSQARPEDVARYVSWGIDGVTHMYNVMRTLEPDSSGVHVFSLPDALLAEPNLALGIIADGIPVHPNMLQWLSQARPDRVFRESDSR